MGVLDTVKDVLEASSQSPNRGSDEPTSAGAYWCDDCDVRIRDVDLDHDGPPDCPECDESMRFERSAASTGCAC